MSVNTHENEAERHLKLLQDNLLEGSTLQFILRSKGTTGVMRVDIYYISGPWSDPHLVWITPWVASVTGHPFGGKSETIRLSGSPNLAAQSITTLLSMSLFGQDKPTSLEYTWV